MTLEEIDAMKWMFDALDHLQQYKKYSDFMAKKGTGFSPNSPFSTNYLIAAMKTTIEKHLVGTFALTAREQYILTS